MLESSIDAKASIDQIINLASENFVWEQQRLLLQAEGYAQHSLIENLKRLEALSEEMGSLVKSCLEKSFGDMDGILSDQKIQSPVTKAETDEVYTQTVKEARDIHLRIEVLKDNL